MDLFVVETRRALARKIRQQRDHSTMALFALYSEAEVAVEASPFSISLLWIRFLCEFA